MRARAAGVSSVMLSPQPPSSSLDSPGLGSQTVEYGSIADQKRRALESQRRPGTLSGSGETEAVAPGDHAGKGAYDAVGSASTVAAAVVPTPKSSSKAKPKAATAATSAPPTDTSAAATVQAPLEAPLERSAPLEGSASSELPSPSSARTPGPPGPPGPGADEETPLGADAKEDGARGAGSTARGTHTAHKKGKARSQRPHTASATKRRARRGVDGAGFQGNTAQLVQPKWDWRPPRRMSPETEALDLVLDPPSQGYRPGAMLELLQQRAADELASSTAEPNVALWRSRWDAKWAGGGEGGARAAPRRAPPTPTATRAVRERATARGPTEPLPPKSTFGQASPWDMVRARVGDIAQM